MDREDVIREIIFGKIEKHCEGLNAVHMLDPPQERKLLRKWRVKNRMINIIHVEGNDYVYVDALYGSEDVEVTPHKVTGSTLKEIKFNLDLKAFEAILVIEKAVEEWK